MISTHCSHPLLHRLALFLLTCLMLAGPVARADEVGVGIDLLVLADDQALHVIPLGQA